MKAYPRQEEFTIGVVGFRMCEAEPIEAARVQRGSSILYELYFESPQIYQLTLSQHLFNRYFEAVEGLEQGSDKDV